MPTISYTTRDGKSFTTMEAAVKHEEILDLADVIENTPDISIMAYEAEALALRLLARYDMTSKEVSDGQG